MFLKYRIQYELELIPTVDSLILIRVQVLCYQYDYK